MKKILILIALFGVLICQPVIQTGCSTPTSERVQAYQTLAVAGHSAEGIVALSAQLYSTNKITAEQARKIVDFYNQKWQPSYKLAVQAAQSDLSSYASPDILRLLAQLSALLPAQ